MRHLEKSEYKEALDSLTRAVYPILKKMQDEGGTSPQPGYPGYPEILEENSELPPLEIEEGNKGDGETIVTNLCKKTAEKISWEYKHKSYSSPESSDGYRGAFIGTHWIYVPVRREEVPVPEHLKKEVKEYHRLLELNKAQKEADVKYDAAFEVYRKEMEDWCAESINNWLISASIELDFMPGKICMAEPYEEYPSEINLYLLQEVVNQYS